MNARTTDAELVSLLKDGNQKAFEEIYNCYWYKLFCVAYYEIGSREDAEELVHDLFESIWNKRGQVHINHLSSYLVASIKHLVTNYIKSKITHRRYQEYLILHELYQAFVKASRKLVSSLVETPAVIKPTESKTSFVFDRTPLTRVLALLGKAYGIEFIVENPVLNYCVFNGDLNDLPLYVQLDLLCKSINAHYERRGTTLFIHGESCLN